MSISIVYFLSVLLSAFLTTDEKSPELMGSWEISKFINHENNETEWSTYPDQVLFQKHITNTHFTWIKYDMTDDQLLGLGGGTYAIKDGKYIENIDFFYPPGSNELGQSIPFDVEVKKGKWEHVGFIKTTEIDQLGRKIEGTIKIEETWKRTKTEKVKNKKIRGSWDLKNYRESLDDDYQEYPAFTGYMKLITDSHFVWIKYDKDGDQIFGAGAGTYTFDSNDYTENISMIYPSGSDFIGKSVQFKATLTKYRWDHFGYLPIPSPINSEENFLIDEIWIPHQSNAAEDAAFSY